jgi:hypothetical protein
MRKEMDRGLVKGYLRASERNIVNEKAKLSFSTDGDWVTGFCAKAICGSVTASGLIVQG